MTADLFGLEQQPPRTNSRPEAAAWAWCCAAPAMDGHPQGGGESLTVNGFGNPTCSSCAKNRPVQTNSNGHPRGGPERAPFAMA